jgi:hypothetical protein
MASKRLSGGFLRLPSTAFLGITVWGSPGFILGNEFESIAVRVAAVDILSIPAKYAARLLWVGSGCEAFVWSVV